jgi:hypothetical protein
MKLIGLKYCGGCNPQIDRTDLVKAIGKLLPPDFSFTADISSGQWDMGILVCGCNTACTDRRNLHELTLHWVVIAGRSIDNVAVPEKDLAREIIRKIQHLMEHISGTGR